MTNYKCSDCNSPIELNQKYCEKCGTELIWDTTDDSEESTKRTAKRIGFGGIYFLIVLFYIGAVASGNFISLLFSILLIFPIWFFSDKENKETNIKNMFLRISKFRKKYKVRSIISGILFLSLFILGLVSAIDNSLQEKNTLAEKQAYDNAPIPIIQILSQTGNLGDNSSYNLIFTVSGANEVIVDSGILISTGNTYKTNVSLSGLNNNSKVITIVAKNKYKDTQKFVSIYRNKTAEEIKIENQEKERIANEQAQGEINILDGYIKEMKEGYSFYDVATISTTAYRLEALWGLIKTDLDNQNAKIVQKAKETKTKLISTQKLVFPKLRAERCSLTKNTMWEYNVDVKCYGGTVKFIGGTFASNSNIKDSYSAVSDMLDLLRFKKASFYRYEGSDYTYYTIDSPSDGTLE